TSERARSRSAASFRSSTIERLPRFSEAKFSEKPPRIGGHWRSASPPGGSTLMTSAPKSASSIAQNGPAATWQNSTTRTPASGRGSAPESVASVAAALRAVSGWRGAACIGQCEDRWKGSRTSGHCTPGDVSSMKHATNRRRSALAQRREVGALEHQRYEHPGEQPPERRPDVQDREIGDGDEEGHQRAEREATAERRDERGLQHAQHRQAGERRDERRRRREHQAREERRQQTEREREHADDEAAGVVPLTLSGRRDDRVGRSGEAGGDGADEGGDDRARTAGDGHRVDRR